MPLRITRTLINTTLATIGFTGAVAAGGVGCMIDDTIECCLIVNPVFAPNLTRTCEGNACPDQISINPTVLNPSNSSTGYKDVILQPLQYCEFVVRGCNGPNCYVIGKEMRSCQPSKVNEAMTCPH